MGEDVTNVTNFYIFTAFQIEIFKTDVLEKEFEKFQKENLIQILEYGYCQKTACGPWHKKFLASCKYCREKFRKTCHNFNVVKSTLLENSDLIAKDYIENFIKDFLCISDETLKQESFEVTKRVPIEKSHTVKTYSKSEKIRSQVINKNLVNCEKISYLMNRKSRTFYKKI